jgi:hypothetical protein
MTYIKTCHYCGNRIIKEDMPFDINGIKNFYTICRLCRAEFNKLKKSSIEEFMDSKYQECCTNMIPCCEDHAEDEHECLHDIKQIILE